MEIETLSYLNEEGVLKPGYTPSCSLEVILHVYQVMKLTRAVDERMVVLQRQGQITFAMSSLGEEACAVATVAALDKEDWVYPQYRESGAMFYRGFSVVDYVHNMFGDALDLNKGRQMPNHFGSRNLNVVTVSSPIGTKIPHAAGAAYAMKLQKEPHIALVFFGEGATSEGDFHAGMNFASVLQVPCIFFCRNNQYAISTKLSCQFHSEGVAPKAVGYGMLAKRVDGNDFFAVYESVKSAKQAAIEGNGPTLIEAMTYRQGAHSTSDDPSVYRRDAEVEKWKLKDPLVRLRRYLEKENVWDQEKEKQLEESILQDIQRAIETAKTTARPAVSTLIEDVYEKVPEELQAQYKKLQTILDAERDIS